MVDPLYRDRNLRVRPRITNAMPTVSASSNVMARISYVEH